MNALIKKERTKLPRFSFIISNFEVIFLAWSFLIFEYSNSLFVFNSLFESVFSIFYSLFFQVLVIIISTMNTILNTIKILSIIIILQIIFQSYLLSLILSHTHETNPILFLQQSRQLIGAKSLQLLVCSQDYK